MADAMTSEISEIVCKCTFLLRELEGTDGVPAEAGDTAALTLILSRSTGRGEKSTNAGSERS
jgi:hypothetical protein